MKTNIFEKLICLYRAINFDSSTEGLLILKDQEQVELAAELLKRDPYETGLTLVSGDPNSLAVGGQLKLEINPPKRGLGIVAADLGALIEAGRVKEPRNYYVRSEDYLNGEESPPAELASYRAVLSFIELLAEASAYLDVPKEDLVFINKGRFSVPIQYTLASLRPALLGEIESVLRQFGDDMHRDQKLEILASTTHDLTSNLKAGERFEALLSDMADLSKKVGDGYRLFASGFSYDRIKGEIQDANIEFTGKIHKTFSDIQSQLLAIPVATVIVATQMKHAEGIASQFWINTGVVIGSVIFTILTWILITNQRQTMAVLGEEIDRREQTIAKDHEKIKDLLAGSFDALRGRLDWQRRILGAVCLIVSLGLIATLVVYAYLLYLP